MSRAERRQYQKLMKGADRAPSLPPAARVRAERLRARRQERSEGRTYDFTGRFWMVTGGLAVVAGLIGFSVQWPAMPFALYVGIAAAAVALALQVGLRLLQRRAAAR
jgi:hypothetical protein